ncbi:MAG TPA: trypsin-like peptidase domain-containing protein, partial [Verrucomicrobiales bacterium]|nr:trypsin-like peptidase domain-containing protein [Verrucomicrobiales bacterium]
MIPRILLPPLIVLIGSSVSDAQQLRMSTETLLRVKQAAVYIKVGEEHSFAGGTGSGFVFRREGEYAYIATNEHVAGGMRNFGFTEETGEQKEQPIEIVFESGTSQELTVAAERLVLDADFDLAVLRVKMDPDRIPQPVNLTSSETLTEILPIYFFGFPLGRTLSVDDENPAISVGQGYVSSVRKDKYGTTAQIQIDADLNPGNSGGAVTDANGDLVGVAVSGFGGTNISFCIPAQQLRQVLAGKISNVEVNQKFDADALKSAFTFKSHVLDPLGRGIEGVTLLATPAVEEERAEIRAARTDDGSWSAIKQNMREVPLELKDNEKGQRVAEAVFELEGKRNDTWIVQARYAYKDGTDAYSSPGEIALGGTIEGGMRPGVRTEEGEDPELNRSGANLRGSRQRLGKGLFSSFEIDLDASQLLPVLAWSKDHRAIYPVQSDGTIRRLEVPSCVEDRKVALGEPCSGAALSSAALLVQMRDKPEIRLLSLKTLDTRKTVELAEVVSLTASPAHGYAVVSTNAGTSLAILDTAEATILRTYAAGDFPGIESFGTPTFTFDGTYLLTISGDSAHRFAFAEGELEHEAAGPAIFPDPIRIDVSVDSKYFAAPCRGGNRAAAGGPDLPAKGAYLFRVDDLDKPRVALDAPGTRTVGPDIQEALLYAHDSNHQLLIFDAKGGLQESITVDAGAETRQMLVHPAGKV